MVIELLLQLTPATFSIFYHHALGKYGNKKADNLSLSFIFGVELFTAAICLSIYFIVYAIFVNLPDFRSNIILWILAGIAAAEAIVFFCCYFHQTKSSKSSKSRARASTTLFLSRRFARALTVRAESVQTRRDALALGFFVGVPELIFTLPLIVILSLLLTSSVAFSVTAAIIVFVLIATVPLFTIRTAFRAGLSLASIQRFRASARPAIRLFVPLCLLALAGALINLGFLWL